MRPTCSGLILLIQLIRPPLVDQEEVALLPLVFQRMSNNNIQILESNSLISNSVRSTLLTLHLQDQAHLQVQVHLQHAQEEALQLALVCAHLLQLLLSKPASMSALQDAP